MFGAREAAWPLIRADLRLSYVQIGLLITIPSLVGALVEPGIAVLGDTRHRRRIVVAGGAAFVVSAAAFALSPNYGLLLAASIALSLASGAFVSLSQASLMDLDPAGHERSMARWVVAGSVGVVVGPLLVAGAAGAGLSWRVVMFALAAVVIPGAVAARVVQHPPAGDGEGFLRMMRSALRAARRASVLRWLVILELTDLMGDVLFGFLALYFVDVARVDPAAAGLAVFAWSLAGLVGDVALLRVLGRVDGVRALRWSAAAVAAVFPAFLLVDGLGPKLVLLSVLGVLRAGWYAIPKGRLFSALPGASGTAIALSDLSGLFGRLAPVGLGGLAEAVGLGAAMWALLLAPVALLVGLPRGRTS